MEDNRRICFRKDGQFFLKIPQVKFFLKCASHPITEAVWKNLQLQLQLDSSKF